MKPKQGYLIITDHDGDEITVELITDKKVFNQLKKAKDHDEVFKIRGESEELTMLYSKYGTEFYKERHFSTQTLCSMPWPFNGVEILGTYYHSIY